MAEDVVLMKGNEAIAHAAVRTGVDAYFGYPITPQSEVLETLAELKPWETSGMVVLQAESEVAAINMVYGGAATGKKVMTSSSSPGVSLKQEGISYIAGAELPAVIVNVMRGGPAGGQATFSSQQDVYQTRYGTNGEYEPIVLAPSSTQECFDMTVRAFNLAETYLTPVIVLMDEVVGHTREAVFLPDSVDVVNRRRPPEGHDYHTFEPIAENHYVPYRINLGEGRRIVAESQLYNITGARASGSAPESAKCVQRLLDKIRKNTDSIVDVFCENVDGAEVVMVGWGSTARVAQHVARIMNDAGRKVGFVKLNTIFPFAENFFARLLQRTASDVIFAMPEMNSGKLYREVRLATGRPVISIPKLGGEMHTPSEIIKAIWG